MNWLKKMWAVVLSVAMVMTSSTLGSVNAYAYEGDILLDSSGTSDLISEDMLSTNDSVSIADSQTADSKGDTLKSVDGSSKDADGLLYNSEKYDNLIDENMSSGKASHSDEGTLTSDSTEMNNDKEGDKIGVKVGDLYYAYTDLYAEVTGWEPDNPEALMDVTIPSYIILEDGYEREVVAIANGAFSETGEEEYRLRSVRFAPSDKNPEEGSSVKIIGEGAFKGCTELTEVIFPEYMTRTANDVYGFGLIASRAFEGCTKLKTINLPKKLDLVGEALFKGCSSLTSIEIPSGWENTVVLKDQKDGKSLADGKKNIDEVASALDKQLNEKYEARSPFSDCETLTEITFANDTRSIASCMLADCDSITDISIADNITTIKKKAFYGCGKLENIEFSSISTLREIGDFTFQKCEKLIAANLPNTTKTIGRYAFVDCSELEETSIPYSISLVGDYAYCRCVNLTYISFEKGIKESVNGGTIGKYAFGDTAKIKNNEEIYEYPLSKIRNITIPNSITKISQSAFEACSGLTSLVFDNSIANFDEKQEINIKAFYKCTSLSELKCSDSLVSIGDKAFYYCTSLSDVAYSNSLESIGTSAFENCTSLETITMTNSIKKIGVAAFKSCSSLSTLKLSERLEAIGQEAFSGDISLTRLDIPMSLKTVGPNISNGTVTAKEIEEGVFYGSGLRDVTFIRYNKTDVGEEKADGYKIPDNILLGGLFVENIVMPEGETTEIGSFAFAACSSLKTIDIPDSCVYIRGGAFGGCSTLGKQKAGAEPYTLVIPDNVTSIGRSAFKLCESLERVQLPASLETLGDGLGDGAFESCISLREIDIPDTVNVIGAATFAKCEKLARVKLPVGTSKIDDELFSGCLVLTEVKNVSKDSLVTIGNGAFKKCMALTSFDGSGTVDFSAYKKLTGIGKEAFAECENITTVVLSAATTSLGAYTFNKCKKLANVTIGTGPKEIPEYAFAGSLGLTAITIPTNVKTIREHAFSDDSNLKEVHIPKNTEIEENAFSSCDDELKIYGMKGSPADLYAHSHGITFVEEVKYAESIKFTDSNDKVYNLKDKKDIPGVDIKPVNYSVDFEYISSDENVFTIEEYTDTKTKETKHRINAVGVGEAELKVQIPKDADGHMATDSFKVTVKNPVKSVTAGKDASGKNLSNNQTINIPDSLQLSVTVNLFDSTADPKGLTDLTCTWTSRETSICSVDSGSGLVRPVSVGTTTVTATSNDDPTKSFSYNITVTHNVMVTDVKFSKTEETVEEGKTIRLAPEVLPSDATNKAVSYKSNAPKIATVDENGLVTGVKEGTTEITVTTKDGGKTANCKITVVKPSDFVSVTGVKFAKATEAIYVGDKVQLSAEVLPENATDKSVSYKSNDSKTVSVDTTGLITGIKEGKATITVTTTDEKKTATCVVTVYSSEEPDPSSDEFIWSFDDEKKTATLVRWNGNHDGNAVIPSEVINENHPDYQDDGKRKVVAIAANAFKGRKANIVKLPDTLEIIKENAFDGCTTLPSLTIPEKVTEIEGGAFNNCTSLEEIELSKNLVKLGNNVFTGCISLKSIKLPKSIATVSPGKDNGPFTGSSLENFTFDEGTNKLADNLFYGCGSVKNLVLPESVTTIGKSTFKKCANLESISISDKATEIGDSAFEECSSLVSIKIPKYIEKVGNKAFYMCESLKSASIPHSVTSIGTSAFGDCTGLETFEFRRENTALGCTLGNKVFMGCTSLKAIILPESVEEISEQAFEDCTSLTSVKFPESLTKIDKEAFKNCKALGRNAEIVMGNNVETFGQGAFEGCIEITEITLSAGLKTLGKNAFKGCEALNKIELSSGLETIGANAFKGCASLENIKLPKNIKTVEATEKDETTSIFYECNKLKTIELEEGMRNIPDKLLLGCGSVEVISVPDSAETIGKSAFRYCRKLNKIDLPDGLNTIGDYAFAECDVLGHPYQAEDNTVKIPSGVKHVGTSAFENCALMQKISLPAGLETLGNSAYKGCKALQSVNIPSTVTSIGTSCFEGCAALTDVALPGSASEIPSFAFKDCGKLARINLPKTITKIGAGAFNDCDALTNDIVDFSECKQLAQIGNAAFENCDGFTRVVLSSSTKNLGEKAFHNCAKLADIDLGIGLSTVPQYAFADLASLVEMTIPSNVTTIMDYAFQNDRLLTKIHIPKTTTSISTKAFSYKDQLTIWGVKGSEAEKYAEADPEIKFREEYIEVKTIKFSDTVYKIDKGNIIELPIVEVDPVNYSEDLSYKSSNEDIFTVGTDAKTGKTIIRGVATGKATLTVMTSDTKKTATTSVEITEPVTKVTINGKDKNNTIKIKVSTSVKLSTTIEPENAYDKTIKWESNDPEIAYVDANGTVRGLKLGKTTVTVTTNNNKTDKCTIEVVEDELKEDYVIGRQKVELTANVLAKDTINRNTRIIFKCAPSNNSHIYYTLDGTKAMGDYTGKKLKGTYEYKEPITISESTVINVKAVCYGYQSVESVFDITVDDWGDIGVLEGQRLFGGDASKVPQAIWYAFVGDDNPYEPSSEPQVTKVSKESAGKKVMFNEEISVFYGTERLVEGRDYKVIYNNNTDPAAVTDANAPTVRIKGIGNYYKGSSEFKFAITKGGTAVANVEVECLNKEPEYTGKPFTMDELKITLYRYSGGAKTVLKENVDYTPINQAPAFGTFSLKFELIGTKDVVVSDPITVKPYDVKKHISSKDSKIVLNYNKKAEINKAGTEPKVTAKFNGNELQEGVDFKVIYSRNKKITKNAKLKVYFMGYFTGSEAAYYEIVKKDVSQLTVYAEDLKWKDKPGNFKVFPKVVDNGKAVSRIRDIQKFSKSNGCNYYYASGDKYGVKIGDNETVPKDTLVEVRVMVESRANGSYKNKAELRGFYRVYDAEKNIKKATVSAEPIDYNEGYEIIPINETDFKMFMPGERNPLSTDYFEIVSITKNRFIGTATVKVRGRNGYGGIKSFRVKIVKRRM